MSKKKLSYVRKSFLWGMKCCTDLFTVFLLFMLSCPMGVSYITHDYFPKVVPFYLL